MNDNSQRSASYGEILELQEIFNQQVKEKILFSKTMNIEKNLSLTSFNNI